MSNILDFITFLEKEIGANQGEIKSLEMEFRSFRLWSSLNALYLIVRIGEETGVIIKSSELANCKTFRDILNLIEDNGSIQV
jgi:acyl carrier protein